MRSFSKLDKKCPEGISFSECRKLINKAPRTRKKTRRSALGKNRKRKRTAQVKRAQVKPREPVPPKGVVIRVNDTLYRSTGKVLRPLVDK